jgi:signal transduction histidine kinase/ActR/RegA family two-component response regulator
VIDTANKPTSDRSPDSFEAQLVMLLSDQPRRMFLPLSLAMVVIAGVAARSNPLSWALGWFGLAAGVTALRLYLQRPTRFPTMSPAARLRLTVVLVALSACTHGLSMLLFMRMAQFEQAVLSMMLVGFIAGSVATSAGYRPIFLAYVVPTLGSVLALWIFSPALGELGWLRWLMAVLFVLFALVLNALAKDMFRVLRESFDIRQERTALNRELQQALDAAESANRAKTRFLASATHDLRQPMQSLNLLTAALDMRQLDEKSREISSHIKEAVHDLTAELSALLDVSKLDAGIVRPESEEFELRPVLHRVKELFAPMANQKQLGLELECAPGLWVKSDRKLLERVVRNLVENAVKYTEHGHVAIDASLRDGRCELAISDTGCGIDPEEHERIFEEFYQISNPGRDRKLGLGLGLSIVKRTAELLKLSLTLQSALNRGTRFGLSLEVVPPGAMRKAEGGDCAAEPGVLRVLVVDDEAGIRRAMPLLLEQQGWKVDCARDGAEAQALFETCTPDLLIVDYRLGPSENGVDVIKRLCGLKPGMPAFLMTGEHGPEPRVAAAESGIPILDKPVSAAHLLQVLTKIAVNRISESTHEQSQQRA